VRWVYVLSVSKGSLVEGAEIAQGVRYTTGVIVSYSRVISDPAWTQEKPKERKKRYWDREKALREKLIKELEKRIEMCWILRGKNTTQGR
jgi:hypothetical protein